MNESLESVNICMIKGLAMLHLKHHLYNFYANLLPLHAGKVCSVNQGEQGDTEFAMREPIDSAKDEDIDYAALLMDFSHFLITKENIKCPSMCFEDKLSV